MSEAARQPGRADLGIRFRNLLGTLHAHVTGTSSLQVTIDYWRAILVEVRKTRPQSLLLVDELRGPALGAQEWKILVEAMAGQGLEGVRIAHVKPHGLQKIEYCEIFAGEAGFDARVFDNETTASLWLRYGSHQ